MDAPTWTRRTPPPLPADRLAPWTWQLQQAADLTTSRTDLRTKVLDAGVPPGDIDDAVERLLLAYEELASNGLKHGSTPVSAEVTAASDGWLIDVTDSALDRSPSPDADRDPAHGGLGLYLITRLCGAYGWTVTAGRKHVWGYVHVAALT
jgi:anti-sigma regulatory factor (Ser/Thr protein kinase)